MRVRAVRSSMTLRLKYFDAARATLDSSENPSQPNLGIVRRFKSMQATPQKQRAFASRHTSGFPLSRETLGPVRRFRQIQAAATRHKALEQLSWWQTSLPSITLA
jgi:hypothetical protein